MYAINADQLGMKNSCNQYLVIKGAMSVSIAAAIVYHHPFCRLDG